MSARHNRTIRRAKGDYIRARMSIEDMFHACPTEDFYAGSLCEALWLRHRQRAEQAARVIRARGGLAAVDDFVSELSEVMDRHGGPDMLAGSLAIRAEQAYQRFRAHMQRAERGEPPRRGAVDADEMPF